MMIIVTPDVVTAMKLHQMAL